MNGLAKQFLPEITVIILFILWDLYTNYSPINVYIKLKREILAVKKETTITKNWSSLAEMGFCDLDILLFY